MSDEWPDISDIIAPGESPETFDAAVMAARRTRRRPTRAELLALVERWREKSDRWTRVNRGPDTRVAGGVWGDAARELAALLGGCDG